MLWRDRRAPLAAVVILAAYAAMLLTGIGWAGQMSLGWPEVRLGETLRLLLGFDTALLVWRLGMRSYFTTRCYGWRQGLLALPRAFVANIIAMFAARREIGRAACRGRVCPDV